MARVSYLGDAALPAALQPLFAIFAQGEGGFENQARVLAHSPAVFQHAYGMALALREAGTLPRRLIEIVVVATSAANRCRYCVGHHAPVLEAEGLAADTVARILARRPGTRAARAPGARLRAARQRAPMGNP
jgi:AhpD family alkylhydroperoxidase